MEHRRRRTSASLVLVLVAVLAFIGAAFAAEPIAAAPLVLLGDSAIEPTADASGLGTAEANRFVAATSGTVDTLSIYLDTSNRATTIALGLYRDAAGVPGTLITQGTRSGAPGGAWMSVAIPPTALTASQSYWIARLSQAGGEVVTRIAGATNADRGDTRTSTTLPATFSPGGSWPHRTSMYASDSAGVAATPTPTPALSLSPTPTATPAAPPTPIPPSGSGFVGNSAVEGIADPSGVGTAEATQYTATSSGPVSSISIYVDSSNAARSIALGLYSDASDAPGTLLAQGTLSTVSDQTWNTVSVATISLSAGTRYWIARLSTGGGTLVTRVNSAPNPDRADTRSLSTLPATFSPGGSYPHRASIYAGTAAGATPSPTPSPTPAPTDTPIPTPTATPVAGSCMEVIGFSQTQQWYFGGPPGFDQFLTQMPQGSTQLRWQGGASIDTWSDPAFSGWTGPLGSNACNASSANPDRIVLTISGGYSADVNWWHDQVAQAVANAWARYSNLRTVYLQPVIGGPGHGACFIDGVQVRATYNEPYIDQAIDRLQSEGVGIWGANPLVRTCADFNDDIGHLVDDAKASMATTVGAFYRNR